MILNNYLNVRYSTKNLSDIEFEKIVPILAKELESISFYVKYTDKQLIDDYAQLVKYTSSSNTINSTNRVGMKICEHFFENFYDIENPSGNSFRKLWTASNLEKILRWNRKSHSTPYLSELKRGIYFCCGLTKNTMYRPQLMKLACMKYKPNIVLDPCAGWGGRMLGATSYGATYIAFEPNTKTWNYLHRIVDKFMLHKQVKIICDDARNMHKYDLPKVDMVLTSPPYFDLEIYSHEPTQSSTNTQTYETWANNFLREIIKLGCERLNKNGVSCYNVGKVKNRDMNIDVEKYHNEFGYEVVNSLDIVSSKRQSNQSVNKNSKSVDKTVIYKRLT